MALNTILVPTDCSELSARALRYADRLALRTGAGVLAVYGERFSARPEGEGVAAALAGRDDLDWMTRGIRRCMTDELTATLSPETIRGIVIADEPPADAIVNVAHRRKADLIVMTTRDRNRLARAVLGSTTDSVLAGTNLPVVILREHNGHEDNPMQRIVCPFRDSAASIAAVEAAASLARAFAAELVLLHLVDDSKPPAPSWVDPAVADCRISNRAMPLGDEAGRRIVATSEELAADLLVIGTTHRRYSDAGANTPAGFVVRSAHCPVLTVTV